MEWKETLRFNLCSNNAKVRALFDKQSDLNAKRIFAKGD